MKKKELRKQLETVLINSIEATLTARNKTAVRKIGKTVKSASKEIAKKFYKAVTADAGALKKATAKKKITSKATKPKSRAKK